MWAYLEGNALYTGVLLMCPVNSKNEEKLAQYTISPVPKYKSMQRFHHEPHADVYRCILSVDSFILFRMQWNLYKDLSTSNSQPPLLGILYPLLEPHHQN